MKIIKQFTKQNYNSFFWDENMDLGICSGFIGMFIPVTNENQLIKVTLSTNNPKKKGFNKVNREKDDWVSINDKSFSMCYTERITLNDIGIKVGDSFWMKVDNLTK